MKIFFDCGNYINIGVPKTGIYNYIYGLFKGFQELEGIDSFQFKAYSFDNPEFVFEKIKNYNFTKFQSFIDRLTFSIPKGQLAIYRFFQYFNKRSKEINHIMDIGNYYYSENVVLTYCDLIPIKFPSYHMPFVIQHHKQKLKIAKTGKVKILSISENTKNDLIELGVPEQNIVVTELFSLLSESNTSKDTKLNPEPPYFISVATLEPRKNLKILIQAFLTIKSNPKYKDFKLKLVGKAGWGNNEIPNHPDIELTGFVSEKELISLLKKAIALVYPSLYEGFGLPVLEAMSLGTPVISSNTSSLPEVGGDAVLYFTPLNKDELIERMIELIEDEKKRSFYSAKGLERSKAFSTKNTAKKTIEAYQKFFN